MKSAVQCAPGDIRLEEREAPRIVEPTDAILRLSATCICGSDLWDYRGINSVVEPKPVGHEYRGIVEQVGGAVHSITPAQFVIGSFFASDNTCPNCKAGYLTSCLHRQFVGGAQATHLRVPLADGTLVATPEVPPRDLIPSLLSLSDVMGTGWFAAVAANAQPGSTVAVVGDGAVGLLGVLAPRQMGAERIIAMSRNESRQKLASEFGATDIVTERGDEGVARVKELTNGIGATRCWSVSGPRSRCKKRVVQRAPAARWVSSACRTGSRSAASGCFTPTSLCMVDPHLYGVSSPS